MEHSRRFPARPHPDLALFFGSQTRNQLIGSQNLVGSGCLVSTSFFNYQEHLGRVSRETATSSIVSRHGETGTTHCVTLPLGTEHGPSEGHICQAPSQRRECSSGPLFGCRLLDAAFGVK